MHKKNSSTHISRVNTEELFLFVKKEIKSIRLEHKEQLKKYLANWDKIVCSCVPNKKQMCQLSCVCVMFHTRATKNSSQE